MGNPLFLGAKKLLGELGEDYTLALRKAWGDTVPGFADLVCYWFAKAWSQMQAGELTRAGLVSTNSIRGGANREVLKPIVDGGRIFEAWSDEAWTVDGAAVRVSMVCFDGKPPVQAMLDGGQVVEIQSNLSSNSLGYNLTEANRLTENANICFEGMKKYGDFDVPEAQAREWLRLPTNVNGAQNTKVLRRLVNAMDIVRRPEERLDIDFNDYPEEADAACFEAPFKHASLFVYPARQKVRDEKTRRNWWLYERARPALRGKLVGLERFICTPRVAKHRIFVWLPSVSVPDTATDAIARDDDATFGILHSRFHELWSLRMGTFLGVGNDPRYTSSTTFETFPFPEGLTPNIPAADCADDPRAQKIAVAAARLNELRENWLNPADLVSRVPEVIPGYPDRILPKDEAAEKELKKRTLTNLYNARPAWLDHAHKALDEAVAEAYGWGDDWRSGALTEDETLSRLFHLNQSRAAAEAKASKKDKTNGK